MMLSKVPPFFWSLDRLCHAKWNIALINLITNPCCFFKRVQCLWLRRSLLQCLLGFLTASIKISFLLKEPWIFFFQSGCLLSSCYKGARAKDFKIKCLTVAKKQEQIVKPSLAQKKHKLQNTGAQQREVNMTVKAVHVILHQHYFVLVKKDTF